MFEEGPVRKRLREKGFLKRGLLASPQEIPYEKLIKDVMSLTGLSEADAIRFVRYIGTDPYLYVIYGVDGKVLDWDSRATREEIWMRADAMFAKMWGARSYKIFVAKITMEKVAEKP